MSIRDTLKQIEAEKNLLEANPLAGAIEKGIEKLGFGLGKFKGYAQKAKQAATGKPAPAPVAGAEKAAPGVEKTAPQGYVPAKPDQTAIAGLNAEQKQLSDYFANPKNHVTKDGKVWGRDPKNVGEFIELDAKTFLPKGQIGVNRAQYYAPGHVNRELQALEKLGPREVAELEAKAMASKGLTAAEKTEIKSGGIVNWIKKNPKKASLLGLLTAIAATGVIGNLGGEEDVAALPSDSANVAPATPTKPVAQAPAEDPLVGQINSLIAELEKEPDCKAELDVLKAEWESVRNKK